MKRVKWILLAACSLLLAVAPVIAQLKNLRLSGEVTTWPGREKRFALLVGVNTYDDSQITPLVGAANDMVMLEDALVKYGGFDRDRVVRLTTDATEPMARPSSGNILQKLSNVLKAVPADGLVVLAFSGHGIERENRAYLLPTDAQVNGDIELLERTALEVASLRRMIENRRDSAGKTTGVAQVLVLLDACRNDPTSGKDNSANRLSNAYDFNLRNSTVQAFATIYATSRGERAYENRVRKHGYFIAEVVAGLSGAAANAQGEVTLQRLVSYLEDKVPTKVTLDLGHRQRPFMELKGYKAAELVISVNRDLASAPVSTPANSVVEPIAAPRSAPLTPVISRTPFKSGTINANGKLSEKQGECEVYTEDLGNGVKLEMVRIPAGKFMMGSPANELGRYKDEGPQREVSVAGYLMGKYEVTQRIWKAVARYPKVELELNEDPARFKGENLPVEQISWNEVKEFIARLNKRLGLTEEAGYRLPSEAEWEYAARAGTKTPFGFGETIDPRYVNYDGNYLYGRGRKGQYRQRTIEVGRLGVANRFGLYEMHGNVWEWCEDEFHESYNGAPVDGSAWVSSAMATARVVHGGGWYSSAVFCRSAFRDGHTPGVRNDALGFRLSRAVP